MKTLLIQFIIASILVVSFGACKKEVYPEELQFLVVDSFTRKPISNASVYLYKVWQHPVKIGDNSTEKDWFPEYGRKHMSEKQEGKTDENGKVTFSQEHKKYLYILPGFKAEGYQMTSFDTLQKFKKKNADDAYYTIALVPYIKTTFIIKSHVPGFDTDSVVFASSDKQAICHGKNIDGKLEVFSNSIAGDSSASVWYTASIFRNGKKSVLCNSVKSYFNKDNTFEINVDL